MLKKTLWAISISLFKRELGAVLSSIIFSVALTCRADYEKVPADKSKFHIFVLMGQSNMAGSGQPVLPEYIRTDQNVLIIGNDMKWTYSKINFGGGMGPGNVFAHHYAELHPEVTVGLIQGARGGRSLKELVKGGKDRDGSQNYDNTMAKIKEAMKAGTIKAVLWHQGESDCTDAGYVDKLKSLVNDIRSDIGDNNIPFIAGELGRFSTVAENFNSLMLNAKTEIPYCTVVSSEKLMDLGDKVHFSGFSVEVLGSRYLMEYLNMMDPQFAVKFKPNLYEITAKMQAKDSEWDTLINPSMSDGETRPLGWDGKWVSKGNIDSIRDVKDFTSAPASLMVKSVGGPVTGSVSTPLRNVSGKNIKITCKMKNAGFADCSLNINGMNSAWKQELNKDVINAKDAKEWTTLSGECFVPLNVVNSRLAVVVNGEGNAWLDDISIKMTEPAMISNIVLNGSMDKGNEKPDDWGGVWTASGKIVIVKDTKEFKSGPASIRLDSDGGPVKGTVSQSLSNVAGKTLKISGFAKCKGPRYCTVGVGAFDSSKKMLKWMDVFGKEGDSGFDWTEFEKVVDIPANAVKVTLGLGIVGEGSVWFDDIGVNEIKKSNNP